MLIRAARALPNANCVPNPVPHFRDTRPPRGHSRR